jgi:hypothetical protein
MEYLMLYLPHSVEALSKGTPMLQPGTCKQARQDQVCVQ